ncbi:thiamine ABC transporter ATP-binding protein [Alisedimentitalea sp. MJ-SS2]|uniref:thiamine ABC transporter ATP-binding protein n=1 Tax=Aliisedimentitalea sp. MJ-SS2 TaxID=3049795 RepID=UPI002909EFCC|nr:thiamine ABC transporter ATP-binding protein [Alisedimentitalea sp. MJ-SS2]MDU8927705.1 thiamine ABC transporter ATP-binding protein [Alisedimentitalea sp. MJ-SS2]
MLMLEAVVIRQDGFEMQADFGVEAGARVAVIGPSGAGKSTLLNAIAGFLDLAEGRVLWDGDEICGKRPGERPIAMLFQDNNLFPHLSVEQNAGLGIDPGMQLNVAQKEQVLQAIARVGLEGLEARKPGQLSGGQQSRAALARVLVQRKPLMLLDEPFAALGPALKDEMLDLVGELASESGATVLMVSHDPRDAERFADQAVMVAEGRAEAPVPVAELLADPPETLRAYLGASRSTVPGG